MKKLFQLIIPLCLGVVMLCGVAGCQKAEPDPATTEPDPTAIGRELEAGAFYSLKEAYDSGRLTKDDLQTIAGYHNHGLSCPEQLSEDIADEMKTAWERENTDSEEGVVIRKYYGTYDHCAAVIMERWGAMYPEIYAPYTVEIGGVEFHYAYARPQIVVWVIE